MDREGVEPSFFDCKSNVLPVERTAPIYYFITFTDRALGPFSPDPISTSTLDPSFKI